MQKICGVYLIISPSGRRYVGSSKDVLFRKQMYNRLECKTQKFLYSSLKKYGFSAHTFKILYKCNEEERLGWERLFGDLYLSSSDFGGLNLNLPPIDGKPLMVSSKVRKQMSDSAKDVGKRPEVIKQRSDARKKLFNNPEFRKIHKERQKIIANRPELKKAASERSKKQFSNPEAVRQMKEKLIQYYIDNPEARKKASDKTKIQYETTNIRSILSETAYRTFGNPETHPRSRKVINNDTGEIIPCAKIAAISINMNPDSLRERLRGAIKNNTQFSYL